MTSVVPDHEGADRLFVPAPPELLQAIGAKSAWSDAVRVGQFVWASGQLGWDKRTGGFADGIEAQSELAFANVRDVLALAGASLADVVSVRVYLSDADHYQRYEPIYQRFFPARPPARVSIVVENIHGALIDVEVLAVVAGA